MGTVRVGEVQPAPIPTKPVPVAGFTRTHTANLQVSSNTAGTRKPVRVYHCFSISTWTHPISYFFFVLFLDYIVVVLLYNVVAT